MANKFSNKVKHEYFTTNQTPEASYIMGLLWADGYIGKNTNDIRLQCLKDDIDYFYPIFKTTGEYNLLYKKQPLNDKICGTIQFSSREVSEFLKENDYINKSISSHRKIMENISKHLWPEFLLGLSDGDGCFYIHMDRKIFQWVITSTYEQEWDAIENIMVDLGIKYRINRVKTKIGGYSQFQVNGPKQVLKVGEYIYNGELGLKRKRDKFEQVKSYVNGKKYKVICYDKQHNVVNEFNTLAEASRWVNRGRKVSTDINDACLKKQPTAFGYIWEKINIE